MMQANWSLILNVLLLVGVIVAIGRLIMVRRQNLRSRSFRSAPRETPNKVYDISDSHDDIIAVRKISMGPSLDLSMEEVDLKLFKNPVIKSAQPRLMPQDEEESELRVENKTAPKIGREMAGIPSTVMMFLLAKEDRKFAGYELLQTVLAVGLRFGEGHLFHLHQFPNGHGPVLCSLATATATGIFDMQNIGAFSVRGLCLYMHPSKNAGIDKERFAVMWETAKQLSEGLDAHLLDDQRKPLTEERISRYYRLLQIDS